MVAQIADRFHVLPSVVARDLDTDPERLSLECVPLLAYAEAFRVYKRGNKDEMKSWRGSTFMQSVIDNDFDAAEAELDGHVEGES